MEDIRYNKRKSFCILGAGGLGRELESWVSHSKLYEQHYYLKGFLDDNTSALKGTENEFKVVGSLSENDFNQVKNILIGIANPNFKEQLFKKFSEDVNLLDFVHPSAVIGKNNTIGKGFVVCPQAVVTCNIKIGDGVFINVGSQVGHDVTIGNYVSIMANVDIGGGAVIGNNVFIGSNAVILPGVKIPDGTKIGAGAVVMRKIKESGTYFGNPAKKIF